MNILIVNFEYPPLGGGGGVATRDIAQELARRHTVHVLTSGLPGTPSEEITAGVHIHRVRSLARKQLAAASLLSMALFVPGALMRGFRILRAVNADVINAQFVIPSGVPALFLALCFRVPLVVSFIGGDIYDPTKDSSPHRHVWLRWLIRVISRHAILGTAISEDTRRRAQKIHGVTLPIVVTHLGIRPAAIRPAERGALGLPSDQPVLVSVGRLIPRKGYDVLLQVAKDLRESGVDVCVAIVGSGPLLPKLKRIAQELGLGDNVRFMGFLSEERKMQVLFASDVYVSTAKHEGFGLVFLEAMEAALPIVAGREGGHTDFLTHLRNALLLDNQDSKEVTRAVASLLRSKEMLTRMRKQNKQDVSHYYLEETVAGFESALKRAVYESSD